MSSVSLKNVSLPPAVANLTLECADHAFTVLLGPRGAGKSAILQLIAGLAAPTTGEILLGDTPIHSRAPQHRDVALASPVAPLLPHLTIEANLSLPLQFRRTPKDILARRIRETAALLGLEPLLNRKPADLGSADLRRAEIGRALALQPKALLLESPLAGLEPVAAAQLRAELARIHQHSRATIVSATDDAAEAMTLASHLVILRHGKIEQQGPPLEIYHSPATVFAAVTLGSPGMNFLRGSLRGSSNQLVFRESDGGAIELPLGDRPAAAAYIGRDVLLGIRPEDCVAIPADHPNGPGVFQTLVDFVEVRGGETLFHAQTGAHSFLSRTPALVDPREAGRRGRFRLEAARAHLFDPATTHRIA